MAYFHQIALCREAFILGGGLVVGGLSFDNHVTHPEKCEGNFTRIHLMVLHAYVG